MAYLTLQDVSKTYRLGDVEVRALDKVSFTLEKGELLIIVGPSGAGKTTLLNILGGMDEATAGQVVLEERQISGMTQKEMTLFRRRDVGFVFQFYNLIPNLTALENVELAAELCPDALDAATVLRQVGLGERLDFFPAQLSGGEQQRVSIARALAKNPRLILCDEPTGALDVETGRQVLSLLEKTCHEMGRTVILITHNTALTAMGDKVIHMRGGKVAREERNPSPVPVERIEW